MTHEISSINHRNVEDQHLTQSDWDRIYAATDNLMVAHLQAGKSVIDASRNFRKAERQHIRQHIEKLGVKIVTIYVDTPENVARQRLVENRRSKTRVDYPNAVFNEIVKVMEPPEKEEDSLTFHYQDDIETWITEYIAAWPTPPQP